MALGCNVKADIMKPNETNLICVANPSDALNKLDILSLNKKTVIKIKNPIITFRIYSEFNSFFVTLSLLMIEFDIPKSNNILQKLDIIIVALITPY